ncbi:MAG: hypothetical protein D6680_06460 [Cyanobacteria bacterium J007]|nr:MAG: hypothetical protein D6680_06460 [Cyanobacteria bacterium J007]
MGFERTSTQVQSNESAIRLCRRRANARPQARPQVDLSSQQGISYDEKEDSNERRSVWDRDKLVNFPR